MAALDLHNVYAFNYFCSSLLPRDAKEAEIVIPE